MLQQPFSRMANIPTVDELIELAFTRSQKVSPSIPVRAPLLLRVKRRSEARLRAFCDILCAKLDRFYNSTPELESLHSFYRALLELLVEAEDYKLARRRLLTSKRIIQRLAKNYIRRIRLSNDIDGIHSIRREAYGRIASVIRRLKKHLSLLKYVRNELRNVPSINPNELVFVVVGYPNVGKSTLVSQVSSAKPKIAEYPFTTTKINVGYLIVDSMRVQIIDTPGLLDRPLSERNKIERLAISAIKYLANVIIFIIDPSESSGYTLEEQFSLFNDIKNEFGSVPILVVLNKIDISSKENIDRCEQFFGSPLLKMIARNGVGVNFVIKEALKLAGVNVDYVT